MSEPKKLLVIAGGTYIYGAEKVTLDVMKGLSKEGYEVNAIISGWNDGAFAKALDGLQVKYHPLKLGWYYTSKIWWSLDSLVHYPGAIIRFLRIRKKIKDWPVYIISFRQVILLWPFFKKKIVYHVHDANAGSRQSRYFLRIIDRKVIKFIAISEFIKEDLVACGISPDKIEVICNGIEILPETQKTTKHPGPLSIGIVGQVIERKGHFTLIEAINLLVKKGMDVQLIIAGGGDVNFIEKLKIQIAELGLIQRIEWRGFKKEIKEIYAGIDVLIAPTMLPEPFGLIAIEANMLGIPVIVSNKGGFKETVVNGSNGFLTEPGDAEELAGKIGYFYNNRNEIDVMGKKGREHVVQYFDQQIMIKKIDKLLTVL
ncbi:MAG: glycosyltransferase family 4 protein [Ferruginibacter sp.]|nr:glycosyltransferase family 4 protein [Ferruginibacter sp.]